MRKCGWEKKIKTACIEAGTYQSFFDEVISVLATILENRDEVMKKYKKLGAEPVVLYTNKSGKSNPVKNPLLVLWAELNKDALAYWRDLGLTPAGYKKINEKAASNQTVGFEDLLRSFASQDI